MKLLPLGKSFDSCTIPNPLILFYSINTWEIASDQPHALIITIPNTMTFINRQMLKPVTNLRTGELSVCPPFFFSQNIHAISEALDFVTFFICQKLHKIPKCIK